MKLALPDLVSNSYFPALAAVELGFFRDEGLDVAHELVFPVSASFAALRDGGCDFVAGSSHAGLAAFPRFAGQRLLCALSHGMYWFLVMRKDLNIARGDLSALRGRRLVAAPMVDVGLRLMLRAGGMDPAANDITIMPLPGGVPHGVSFGVAAAEALGAGTIDGFWANGMGAEVAVERGVGAIVIDVRRGDGPAAAFGFTQPALVATERLLAERPEAAAAAVRAIVRTHRALKADVGLAAQVGRKLFPEFEAGLIGRLIERDLPYYSTVISRDFVASMNRFAVDAGMLDAPVDYEHIVAPAVEGLWER
jgi:ABC-type nitrate/sulfonate/bicarbonate transport system substrate-binding protein